jgi:hypothetical protein
MIFRLIIHKFLNKTKKNFKMKKMIYNKNKHTKF